MEKNLFSKIKKDYNTIQNMENINDKVFIKICNRVKKNFSKCKNPSDEIIKIHNFIQYVSYRMGL